MRDLTAVLVIFAVKMTQSSPIQRNPGFFRNARLEDPGAGGAPSPDSYGLPEQSSSGPEPSGPYPPSGWTPPGDLLLVPGETHSSQQNGYGPPPPPTTERTTTTTAGPSQDLEESEVESPIPNPTNENGEYYVLLPGGKLQKVQYSGRQRGRGRYEAQVQYEEVDTARAPVYSYQGLPVQLPF